MSVPGYAAEELTYAQRNPQTIMLSDGVRVRKTASGYVLETLNSSLEWVEMTDVASVAWGDVTGDIAEQTDVEAAANKSTDIDTDTGSDIKYPSVKAVETAITAAFTVAFASLPATDPVSAGAIWNDGGVLKISVGE